MSRYAAGLLAVRWTRGSVPSGRNREGLSTVAGRAGGPARSSDEAPVMGAERRGRVIRGLFVSVNRASSGRSWVGELKSSGKSFDISKWEVWEAFEKVKANKGAPGVDGCSIEDFEDDLQGESVQDLEPDVLGKLLSPSGAGGGNTETARRRDPDARGAHRRGQDRADGGRGASGGTGGTDVPPGLLWVPAGTVGPGRGRGMPGALLEDRLGDRSGHPEVLRQRPLGPHRQGGRGATPTSVGWCCM